MSTSDAILVGEGWISEHYFTTDAAKQSFQAKVVERRKAWDAEEKEDRPTPRSRFTRARQELVADLAVLGEAVADPEGRRADVRKTTERVHGRLLEILELGGHGLHHEQSGPVVRVSAPGITAQAPLVLVLAAPVAAVEDVLAKDGDTLSEPVQLTDDGPELTSAARLVSALFVAEDAPTLILVLAGRWVVLAEQERWAEGRYLAVDVQAVAERNDTKRAGEIDKTLTCLSAESIAPDADGTLWWTGVLEDSVAHTVGVSQDLRDGVRLSIEIIANDVVVRRREAGLAPLPQDQAQVLAVQSLRFLYRILFLLYAEASPELGVVPAGAQQYDEGYSLDRLRELVQVELATPSAQTGTHLYESLGVLFRLVEEGNEPRTTDDDGTLEGLTFNPLRADLFMPGATAHIDEVGLGNAAVQRVLMHLLLSKERRGRDRGFISYAELGINQLGAVYEGLMSYTGFFAEDDLYEVAKGGDPSKGSWVVPVDRIEGIAAKDFVRAAGVDGQERPVVHDRGTFVFRLAGRERQQSASYYTPEVLTRFTVDQALEELLDQDGHTTTAHEILELTVCEPALGSGAFAIEAVRQLAAQYLERRQKELERRIDPDEYPRRLQEVKAYLALHNVYGVDLNATAVELAEISLWLDTMVSGLQAPWFGLHLRRGNSLIGARRAVYSRNQVADKSWLTAVPRDIPLVSLVRDAENGEVGTGLGRGIHHFLLPADGWGASAGAKEAATLVPDAAKVLKTWSSAVKAKPTKTQLNDLSELGHRVEVLWQVAHQRLRIAEQEIRRSIPVWEAGELPAGGAVQREQIEAALADANGAYQRLRRVMDAWCALWFWPLTETMTTVDADEGPVVVAPPTGAQWISGLQALLGRSPEGRRGTAPNLTFASSSTWDELAQAEASDLQFAGTRSMDKVLREHSWLVVCERVAQQQGFFHWELEFAPAFERGGFDLQVGNPPWVRPRSDVDALLAEGDPWWQLEVKPSQGRIAAKRPETLALPGVRDLVVGGVADVAASAEFMGDIATYPHLQGLQPDSYRCFMEQTWRHATPRGVTGLIHPETHFTDEKAGFLREATYQRLRRHWQFINELQLFEVHHLVSYGVHVYSTPRPAPRFLMATSLYHPDTVTRSFDHQGDGEEPGLKDPEGNWDRRPHKSRIITVDDDRLATWHALLEHKDVPIRRSRMVYAVNESVAAVLDKLAAAPRIGELELQFSAGWHEKNDRTKGYFESGWGKPASWEQVILQGPHLHVATPIYKTPNKTMLHNQDWSATDFETLAPDAVPITAYKPACSLSKYDANYTKWDRDDSKVSARRFYRVGWRYMAANTGERTLTPALIPPGAAHTDGIMSAGWTGLGGFKLALVVGSMSSLVVDLTVRAAPKSTIRAGTVNRLAFVGGHALEARLALRALRLNCVTEEYSELWVDAFRPEYAGDSWAVRDGHAALAEMSSVCAQWSRDVPLRLDVARRQAIVEIDSLVAIMLGLSADELVAIYRTQFAVLFGYDRYVYFYDAHGRIVPNSVLAVWRRKGDRVTEEERTATNQAGNSYTYELPFVTLDREADMRQAYAEFERRLAERS